MAQTADIIAFPTSRILKLDRKDPSDAVSEAPLLRRPKLLVKAARHGQVTYRRKRDLARLMGGAEDLPAPGKALAYLRGREAAMDEARRAGLAEWDLQTHILLLIALLAEMGLAQATAPPASAKTVQGSISRPARGRARLSVL